MLNKEYKRVFNKKKKEAYMKITLVVIPTLALFLIYGIIYENIWLFIALSGCVVVYLIFTYFYLTKKVRKDAGGFGALHFNRHKFG